MGIPSVLVTPLTLGTLRLHDWWHIFGTKMDKLKQSETKRNIVDAQTQYKQTSGGDPGGRQVKDTPSFFKEQISE